ncbi:helix-turn-helix domain-containing protein [Acinetobacter pittii]|uniref:Helix-turn-helix transcriptional regulator n=1 Tax=Acinetobacter pittii TaxID=48296 RepID=A0A6H0G056_ACIPI|nr:helix-turn-helix transcriptional regulator [Acinetobacter pittii]QIT19966.1 helix-turn-helix transcriptional regulator [Acinetobacter pittii]
MKLYVTSRTYLTAYLLYRTRLMYKISLRQMHKYLDLKQSTYGKIETGDLKLTLDNFFLVLSRMGFSLSTYDSFLCKIEETISSAYVNSSNRKDRLLIHNYESENPQEYLAIVDGLEETFTSNIRDFDDLLGPVCVASIDLELADHFEKIDDIWNVFKQQLLRS